MTVAVSHESLAALALWPLLLAWLISTFLPWLVALMTAQTAHPGLKAVLLLILAAVTGVLTEWQANPHLDIKIALVAAATSFMVAVAAHFGLWSPAKISGSDGGIQHAIPGGLGDRRGKVAAVRPVT